MSKPTHVKTQNENRESSEITREGSGDQHQLDSEGHVSIAEDLQSPSNNFAPIPFDEEDEEPATTQAKDTHSDEKIENLVDLFRDFLEAAPNRVAYVSSPSHPVTQQNKARRKRLFGLTKGLSPETGSGNRYDYEQKYPRDEFGKESAENARVWLTYLDEAELFDRERVEGWKETVDVLLVFAGLFSGVITAFISQASQSLQKDNTQVSAFLLFEIAQLLRAQSNGMPTNMIPISPVTPTSRFIPSTNAFWVNGLWFTSLAITLSVALFAVLAKQWLYYYMSSIPGTANEKVRARQLRFNGFEMWKVAAIVDLLPILLHLAVGMFLMGIIILLFPLDVCVAWMIVIITGVTYTLYFISVVLPIWYPECPYTTSLTIYIGILFFVLRQVFEKSITIITEGFRAIWKRINSKARHTVEHLVHCTVEGLIRNGFRLTLKLAGVVRRNFQRLRSIIFTGQLPKFTKWREENIKKAVKNATSLDFEALNWLYATSPNRSVHRIIARCTASNPIIGKRFGWQIFRNLRRTLEVNETNLVDLRFGLCLDIATLDRYHWNILRSIPDVVESLLEKTEYQTYLRIADTLPYHEQKRQTLHNAITEDLSLPLAMWCRLLGTVPWDPTAVAHILTSGQRFLFNWKFDPTRELIHDAGLVRFDSEELGWWKFGYLFRHFELGNPEYSSDAKSFNFETRYLLLIAIYRNLTSDTPLIPDKGQRQKSLENVFHSFQSHFRPPNQSCTWEHALRFFKEICCADSFWCESLTDGTRWNAVLFLFSIGALMHNPSDSNHLPFTDSHDLSLIYHWYSRDLGSRLSAYTPPLFMLLLVPHNRHHLSTLVLNDLDAVSHFSRCLQNLGNYQHIYREMAIYPVLMDLLKSVSPKHSLFTILYDLSVLVQLWKLLVYHKWNAKRYFRLVKWKLERDKLDKLFAAAMNELALLDDWANLPYGCWQLYKDTDDVRSAFATSVREFGQLICVSHTQFEATVDQFAPEKVASDKDHDAEERAQAVSEHKPFHSTTNWKRKVFESFWPKTTSRPVDR